MTDHVPSDPLSELDERLKKARGQMESEERQDDFKEKWPDKAMSVAFRASIELIAAIAVGGGIGLFIDRWLGTSPWGLIGMLIIGFIAGFLNIYRAFTQDIQG